MYKINKSKRQHKFFYYNNKNSTIGSIADAGLPEVYLDRMESLPSGEVTNHTVIIFTLHAQWPHWNKPITHSGQN